MLVGVRPEELSVCEEKGVGAGQAIWRGRVGGVEPLGAETLVIVDLEDQAGQMIARLHRDTLIQVDQDITLKCPVEAIYLFDATSEKAIAAREL